MKHLLNGVAIAAVLAIAAPVWAQAPAPVTSGPTAGQPSRTSGMPKAGTASATTKHRHHVRPAAPSEADQLNAQELSQLQSGAAMPPPPTSSAVPGQPSLTRGIPKAGTPSPAAPTP